MSESKTYVALDLGSNSFHLLISSYQDGKITTLERYSDKVQFGKGLVLHSTIDRQAYVRGLTCLTSFKAHIDRYPNRTMHCYGTQAFRRAHNAADFLEEARQLGFDITVIDGETEASLVYKGVCSSLPEEDVTRLVIDIGGGSTEFALGRGSHLLDVESIPAGCVSWREAYFSDGELNEAHWESACLEVKDLLTERVQRFVGQADEVYISSGTAKLLKNISLDNRLESRPLGIDALYKLKKCLWRYDNIDDVIIAGVKPHRRDLLVPGLSIMTTIMKHFRIDHAKYSKTALREGMLLEMIEQNSGD